MIEHLLVELVIVLVLGIGAQWVAWRLSLPSILMLLLFGFIAGPITHILHPDDLLGDLLFPIVSLSVAIILFEGGLTLHLRELPHVGKVIFRLISLGAVITWAIATIAAYYILNLDFQLSLLLGAILIVTGPTVIGPLLRQIQPKGETGAILKWEGILIDPVGALLAVLIFEAILGGELAQATPVIIAGVLQTILIGVVFGGLGAGLMLMLMRSYWIPDHLHNGMSLLIALAVFVISNELLPESGLLTVTLMGIVLANQRWVSIKHIIEFKENLRVLLIGSLFILLAARLELSSVIDLGWRGLAFVLALVLIARPLSVLASTWGSGLSNKEKLFLSWMAPRGIVAASVASIFAFELIHFGIDGSEKLVSVTFLVIVMSVTLYGLTAGPLAQKMGLSEKNPQGLLIIGAHSFSIAIAKLLKEHGFKTLLVDTNLKNIKEAEALELSAYYGNVLSEEVLDDLDFAGIGRLLALTSNDEVNSLATVHFPEFFSRADIYQLPLFGGKEKQQRDASLQHLHGRFLFQPHLTYYELLKRVNDGYELKAINFNNDYNYIDFQTEYNNDATPLFLITKQQTLSIYATDIQPIPQPGQILIALIPKKS